MKKLILAVDFDRVVHDIDQPIPGRRMGEPIPPTNRQSDDPFERMDAVAAMRYLKSNGCILIVHTLWATTTGGKMACIKWLDYWHVPYDEVTNIKPKADVYLDDRAMKFTNWPQAIKELEAL